MYTRDSTLDYSWLIQLIFVSYGISGGKESSELNHFLQVRIFKPVLFFFHYYHFVYTSAIGLIKQWPIWGRKKKKRRREWAQQLKRETEEGKMLSNVRNCTLYYFVAVVPCEFVLVKCQRFRFMGN